METFSGKVVIGFRLGRDFLILKIFFVRGRGGGGGGGGWYWYISGKISETSKNE